MKKVLFLLGFTLLAACAHDQKRDVASDQQCYSGDSCGYSWSGYSAHYVGRTPIVH